VKGISFEGLVHIDANINRVVIGPFIRFWAEWTGTSSFTLSRILLGLLFCTGALKGILMYTTPGFPVGTYFVSIPFWVGFRILMIWRAERAFGQENDPEGLSAKANTEKEVGRILRLFFMLPLLFIGWPISFTLAEILKTIVYLMILLELYVTYAYTTPGEKSKIKKLLKQLAALPRSIKFPRPVPSPT